jgi:hypothetical protein
MKMRGNAPRALSGEVYEKLLRAGIAPSRERARRQAPVGRSVARHVAEAIALIAALRRPVSTKEIVDTLRLTRNQVVVVRRALRRAQARGTLLKIGADDTYHDIWIAAPVGSDASERAVLQAACAAEYRLRKALGAVPSRFEQCVAALRSVVVAGPGAAVATETQS